MPPSLSASLGATSDAAARTVGPAASSSAPGGGGRAALAARPTNNGSVTAHAGQAYDPLATGYCVTREASFGSTRAGAAWPPSAGATSRLPPGAPPASTASLVRATAARAWAADRTHWLNASAVLASEQRVAGAVMATSGYTPELVTQSRPFRNRTFADEARGVGWVRPSTATLLAAEEAKFHVLPAGARVAHARAVKAAAQSTSRESFGWAA